MLNLYIGNKNYSSWSLRGWLAVKLSGEPFRETMVPLVGGYNPRNRTFSPSTRVPCLHDGATVVWDSLGIAEYLAERQPAMWPSDPLARAFARCASAEMHSGFGALRAEMTMCIRERLDVRPWSVDLRTDVERVIELWTDGRQRFGQQRGAEGDFLCGQFTLVDAFYAPVAFRFRTYGVTPPGDAGAYLEALLAHPLLLEWETAALAETDIIEADEPRLVYRDKLEARVTASGA
ncbi:MAG: glutathione S-transferase family protein [Casimicrobiaceae bacterium]